jgi:hypothetical protein
MNFQDELLYSNIFSLCYSRVGRYSLKVLVSKLLDLLEATYKVDYYFAFVDSKSFHILLAFDPFDYEYSTDKFYYFKRLALLQNYQNGKGRYATAIKSWKNFFYALSNIRPDLDLVTIKKCIVDGTIVTNLNDDELKGFYDRK